MYALNAIYTILLNVIRIGLQKKISKIGVKYLNLKNDQFARNLWINQIVNLEEILAWVNQNKTKHKALSIWITFKYEVLKLSLNVSTDKIVNENNFLSNTVS